MSLMAFLEIITVWTILTLLHCDQNDYTPYIDNVYLNTLPKGIDDNILIKSITDLSSRTQIAKILSSYSDDQVSGFDGVLLCNER